MPATREDILAVENLFERIDRLNEAKSELQRGSVTISFGDFGQPFTARGADFIASIREGAATDIGAQIADARAKLADLGFEG